MFTTDLALEEMAAGNPYRYYHALEVAMRAMFRKHSGELPAHYTSRDFMTYCFDQKLITRKGNCFVVEQRSVDLEPGQVE